MTTRTFSRRPRLSRPPLPSGELALQPPPETPRAAPVGMMTYVMPGAMMLMVVGFIVVGGMNPASLMMGAMMLMMTVGMVGSQRSGGAGKAQHAADRADYLRYLATTRTEVEQVRQAQRAADAWSHPDPGTLWSFAGGRRMWERRQHDDDFVHVRLGTGPHELASPLVPPQTGPVDELDPIGAVALRQFVRTHQFVDDTPQVAHLESFALVSLEGDLEVARGMVRAMLCELATFHGPDGLIIAAAVDGPGRAQWDWLKWLPHNRAPRGTDGLGAERLVLAGVGPVEESLSEELASRTDFDADVEPDLGRAHVVVVVDGGQSPLPTSALAAGGLVGVTVLDLGGRMPHAGGGNRLDLVVRPGELHVRSGEDLEQIGAPEQVSLVEADALARRMAPYRLSEGSVSSDGTTVTASGDFLEMLSLGDLAQQSAPWSWRHRAGRDLMRVPIGVGPSGDLVELDLKESAHGGMGPHGLVIGATGSGKSELLRTLVLGLAATHAPEQLNLVLVDFKGGATFAGLHELPHTAAVITNLQDDLAMVDRMFDALSGEMNRRQEMLRDAGNLLNIRDYERARLDGAPLDPLPWLLVVCDEFSELLTQKPDFAELFVAIGRLGRSLGVHLLLASQRLEEGKLRGLDSHLSYRIGLKTFSAAESRAVLGVPDAYELPPIPGVGYLKFDTSAMTRFKAAYVSGTYRRGAAPAAVAAAGSHDRPVSFVSSHVELGEVLSTASVGSVVEATEVPAAPEPEDQSDQGKATMLDVVVGLLEGQGSLAHEVWLPPLDVSPALSDLLPPLEPSPWGLLPAGSTGSGRPFGLLRAAIGVVDLPYEQRRDPLVLDFSGGAGNAAVVGGPQSGKSVALRSIITSLALTHSPRDVQFYVVDLGGGSLASTAGLPHVGGVVTRAKAEHVRRMVAEVAQVMAERESTFRALGVESIADYRALRATGEGPAGADPFGDVFLVVDGWGAFREEFEDLEAKVTGIAARGLSFGVHVVVAANRWMEIRPAIKEVLGSRLELRLGDPGETEVDRKTAPLVPPGRPGRGLTTGKRQALTALPRIDGEGDPGSLATAYAGLVRQVATAWAGARAPAVRTLPEVVPYSALTAVEGSRAVPFAVTEETLGTVAVDFDADSHLLAFNDAESGRSTLLRVLLRGIVDRYSVPEARILLVDYRRTLHDAVPQEYLAGYAGGAPALQAFLTDLTAEFRRRQPGPDVRPEQLRDRSWWSGPEVFVVIDDYDLVATTENPMLALLPFIAQARDVGLHVIMTRRTAGAGRAMYDPLVTAIRESGAPGLVGSGSRDEGALIGPVRPDPSFPPGRMTLVARRGGIQRVQVAVLPEPGPHIG